MRDFIDYLQTDGFRAYAVENHKGTLQYGGRDRYRKIAFITGTGVISHDRHVYKFDGPVLLFTEPGVSCTWCFTSTEGITYACAFQDEFLDANCTLWNLDRAQYFLLNPVLNLTSEQEKFVRSIFCRMIEEQNSCYAFKGELVQNQICILTHIALRMTANIASTSLPTRLTPVAIVSLELTEIGFPPSGQILHFN